MYTLDTNAVIYYLHGELAAFGMVREIIARGSLIYISAVTLTELLGFQKITAEELANLEKILTTFVVVPVDVLLARKAGLIRQSMRIKTADAIIAATALFTGSTLVTRNTRDFKAVPDLRLLKV